jgi:RNA-directed DNA polymerase
VIRYADTFVIIHEKKEFLLEIEQVLTEWLKSTSELILKDAKKCLKPINQGFDFLGFTFINVNRAGKGRAFIYPSQKSKQALLLKVRTLLQKNKAASSYVIINKLRPIILGWGNYHRYNECNKTFRVMTHLLFQKLRAWVFRRDRRNNRLTIKENYFPSGKTYFYREPGTNKLYKHEDNWILYGKAKFQNNVRKENYLPKLSWIQSTKYIKIANTRSPYEQDLDYWLKRLEKYGGFNASQLFLMQRQHYLCPICNTKFNTFDILDIDHIYPQKKGGSNEYTNLQVLHRHCHITLKKGTNKESSKIRELALNI